MGNSSPNQLEVLQPLSPTWQQQASSFNSPYVILRNKLTGEQLQQYQIFFDLSGEDLQNELKKYNLRFNQDLHLVTVKSIQIIQNKATCAGNKNKLIIRTQRIKESLLGHRKLNYYEGVNVLLKALIGFKAIYQFEGYIDIHQNLIFFNRHEDVKVWMSQKIWLNEPESMSSLDKRYQYQFQPQFEMINKLIFLIQNHLSNPIEFNEIKNKIGKFGTITFQKSIAVVKEEIQNRRKTYSTYFNSQNNSNDVLRRQLENKGLKIVGIRENMRYVEQPGQVIYKQVQMKDKKQYHLQNYQSSSRLHVKNHYLSPQPVRNPSPVTHIARLTSNHKPQTIINSSLQNKISREKRIQSVSRKDLNFIEQPRRTIISPSNNRSIRTNSRQFARDQRSIPFQTKQIIHHPRNINSSPSPSHNQRRDSRSKLVSAPYFHSKPQIKSQSPIQSIPQQNIVVSQIIHHQQPYIAHEPIIRKQNFQNLQISKVSRISLNSNQSTNLSYKKLFSPNLFTQQIVDEKFVKINEQRTICPITPNGNIKASFKQSFPSNNINEPDLEIIISPPSSTITQNNINQNIIYHKQYNIEMIQPQSPKIKPQGWIKMNPKISNNYNFN